MSEPERFSEIMPGVLDNIIGRKQIFEEDCTVQDNHKTNVFAAVADYNKRKGGKLKQHKRCKPIHDKGIRGSADFCNLHLQQDRVNRRPFFVLPVHQKNF